MCHGSAEPKELLPGTAKPCAPCLSRVAPVLVHRGRICLEKGALKTRNPFYSEFATDRAREYEGLHNGILQQLIEKDLEPVSGHIASIPPVLHDEEESEADLVKKVLEK